MQFYVYSSLPSLPPSLSPSLPQFHLRRSQFLQLFNSSPDESSYYRYVPPSLPPSLPPSFPPFVSLLTVLFLKCSPSLPSSLPPSLPPSSSSSPVY